MLNKKELMICSEMVTQIDHCKTVNPEMFNFYLKEIEKRLNELGNLQKPKHYRIKIIDKRNESPN